MLIFKFCPWQSIQPIDIKKVTLQEIGNFLVYAPSIYPVFYGLVYLENCSYNFSFTIS